MKDYLVAYVLDAKDLHIKDMLEYTDYTFKEDIEFSDKSTFITVKNPSIKKDDFVICTAGDRTLFTGIFDSVKSPDYGKYTVTLTQKEMLFNADIVNTSEQLIRSTGIEDWLAQMIGRNWVQFGDDLLDKAYIRLGTRTHTKLPITIDANNGIFNLAGFLKEAIKKYGLRLSFRFNQDIGTMDISILMIPSSKVTLDLQVNDFRLISETYTENILSRVEVAVEKTSDPGHYMGAPYYWLSDGTMTQEVDDPKRVPGTHKAVSVNVTEELAEDIRQAAEDAFRSNLFEHKIQAAVLNGTQLYDLNELYIGRLVHLVTPAGEVESMVTGRAISSGDNTTTFTFGARKTNLVEKLRGKK